MCGIFGFISSSGAGPDLKILRAVAAVTQTRGAHAFGFAWVGSDGKLRAYKRPGAATARLSDLNAVAGSPVVIAHCRYATHGDPIENANNHPHRAGAGWIVHNGVVRNFTDLIEAHTLTPRSECDSEVLGLLIAKFSGSLAQRAARAAASAEGNLAMLGVWRNPLRLLVVRRGNPLQFGTTRDGFYFASLPEGLPGPTAVADGIASVLTFQAGKLKFDAVAVGE